MEQYDVIIAKLQKLPKPLIQEVDNFIDFLLIRSETLLIESDFSGYLANLVDYEDRLARGEIQW